MDEKKLIEEISKILNWEIDSKKCSMRPFTFEADMQWVGVLYEKCQKISDAIKNYWKGSADNDTSTADGHK